MVIVLEYEQAEIKLGLEVEVKLLLMVPVVGLGTTDGKGLALCAYVEPEEGDGAKLLVLLILPLVVKLIVVEIDSKPDDDVLLTCKLVEDKTEEATALGTDVEVETIPKFEDDELCVDDALRIIKLDVVDELVVDWRASLDNPTDGDIDDSLASPRLPDVSDVAEELVGSAVI